MYPCLIPQILLLITLGTNLNLNIYGSVNSKVIIDRHLNPLLLITLKRYYNQQLKYLFIYYKYQRNKKPQRKLGFFFISDFINYSGNAAPVGNTVKSRTMNSAVLVGCMNICPTN